MLEGTVINQEDVVVEDVERMYRLFCRYYTHVDREIFQADWEEKDWALLLRDDGGVLRGFTTMMLYDLELRGRRIRAVFSGNTIIDRASWGEQALVRSWCDFMGRLKAELPEVPLYWYLISSGYRTYLFLPLFFKEFFPRHDRLTPPLEQSVMDHLGRLKFPAEYDHGIVRVSDRRECFRADLALPSPARLRNPHVKFFVDTNSEYSQGDELVCLTEFSLENTRRLAHDRLVRAFVEEKAVVGC